MAKGNTSEEVTFYAYVDTAEGRRLATNCSIIISAKEILDPRTHNTTWDAQNQKRADFTAGAFKTSDPEIINFLDTYNAKKQNAVMTITREVLGLAGKQVVEKVVTKTVIPLSLVKDLDPTQLKLVLLETCDYDSQEDSAKKILEDAKEKGYIV